MQNIRKNILPTYSFPGCQFTGDACYAFYSARGYGFTFQRIYQGDANLTA